MKSVTIALAKRLAAYHELDGTILIGFKDGQYKVASYGDTAAHCRKLRTIVDQIVDEMDGKEK